MQSLHNYRLMCPNALFYREGRICEDCLGKLVPWNGVLHKCYRDDRAASAVVASMLVGHRLLGTWRRTVDIYVAGMTGFVREKFRAGGIPVDRLVLKPNFVFPDPGEGDGAGGYALFAGRLSPEKGVATLLEAWARLPQGRSLLVVGEGRLAPQVEQAAAHHPGIQWLGRQSLQELYALLKRAAFLICPSQWYEALPRILVDSFAVGTPVLASDVGAMAEMVHDGLDGLQKNVELIAGIREKVGTGVEIMLDCWMAFDVEYAVRLAEELRPHKLKWLEEVLRSEDFDAHAELRARVPWQTLATGEHWFTTVPFQHAASRHLVDIFQPDINWVGGLTPLVKICAIAEAAGISVIPHGGGNTPYGQHVAYAMPAIPWAECFISSPPGVPLKEATRLPGMAYPVNGRMKPSDAPGFGVEIDPSTLEPFKY